MSCLEAVENAVFVHCGCIRETKAVAERIGRARHSMMWLEGRLWCCLIVIFAMDLLDGKSNLMSSMMARASHK